jgi:DNA repair protein RadC
VDLRLDGTHRVTTAEVVTVGTLNASLVHPREVFKAAILANAAAIICAHNHPSGDLTPSAEDRSVFDNLRKAGDILRIRLLDFVIVGGSGYWSALNDPSWHSS